MKKVGASSSFAKKVIKSMKNTTQMYIRDNRCSREPRSALFVMPPAFAKTFLKFTFYGQKRGFKKGEEKMAFLFR